MHKFYYLYSLVFVFVMPATVSGWFVWDRIALPQLAIFVIGILALGTAWDIWATRHGKNDPVWLWAFNHKDTLGIRIYDLPIEEYLFYVASSIYIVFLWEGIQYALETQNTAAGLILPCIALWSVAFIALPYYLRKKKD